MNSVHLRKTPPKSMEQNWADRKGPATVGRRVWQDRRGRGGCEQHHRQLDPDDSQTGPPVPREAQQWLKPSWERQVRTTVVQWTREPRSPHVHGQLVSGGRRLPGKSRARRAVRTCSSGHTAQEQPPVGFSLGHQTHGYVSLCGHFPEKSLLRSPFTPVFIGTLNSAFVTSEVP